MIDLIEFTEHYLICALWASTGEDDEPLDAVHGLDDIHATARDKALIDCQNFIEANESDLLEYGEKIGNGYSLEEMAGHDFFLTRNGHGAGFWDRGAGAVGDRLSEMAKLEGETYFYIGDDNYIYC